MLSNLVVALCLAAVSALAGHDHPLAARHHEIAKRAEGAVHLYKRFSNAHMTWYYTQTGNAGSCGKFLNDNEFTVAVNKFQMNPGWCKRTIRITYGGKSAIARIEDTCPGAPCVWGALDLSPSLFSYFADRGRGEITAEWEFEDGTPGPVGGRPKPTPTPTTTRRTTTRTTTTPRTTSTPRPSSSSSSFSSVVPSSSAAPSVNYSSGAASGLATPTGTVEGQSNLADLSQIYIQIGGIAVAGNNA